MLKNSLNNIKLINYLFGATNIAKHDYKSKYVYSGYETAFDGTSSWSFDNNFTRNVAIFGVDNSSSSHTDNRKSNFLVLGEGPTDYINGSREKI